MPFDGRFWGQSVDVKVVIFGLAISSSWGNGHATLWRGLCSALIAQRSFLHVGTEFRARALELGLADAGDLVMDQGGADAFLPTRTLDRGAMVALKKRMVRRFYLRPGYLLRRLRDARNLYELKAQAREGLALLRRNV